MRIPRLVAATAILATVLSLCACEGVVGLAHGDPGRDTSVPPPPAITDAAAAPAQASASASDAPPATTATAPAAASRGPTPDAGAVIGSFSAVTVTFTDEVQGLAAADPRLSTADIATAVENELTAHHLYEPAAAGVKRTLSISIANYTNTLASNASVLGYTFRNAALTGDVQIQGDPALAGTFDVHARSRLTTREAGANGGSLAGLYTRFAVLTVAALRGVEAPQEAVPR
jgi:hypothetical protein